MTKILSSQQAVKVTTTLHTQHKKIVLAGGCFDILHLGHITFLEKAKAQGDILIIFVESDAMIKQTKGNLRPINTQHDRVKILSHLDSIDYLIPLSDAPDYDELVIALKPAIIATTKGDSKRSHKERQAKQIGAKVVDVTAPVSNKSTSRIISLFDEL